MTSFPVHVAPALTLSAYRDMLGDAARPSFAQIEAFLERFVMAHSWYKHLPLFGEGEAFHFWIHPHVPRRTVDTQGGLSRQDSEALRHDIRESGNIVYLVPGNGMHYRSTTEVPFEEGRPFVWDGDRVRHLPRELCDNAGARLTAAVSPELPAHRGYLERHLQAAEACSESPRWPQESGGRPALEQLRGLVRAGGDGHTVERDAIDAVLRPERLRQIALVRATIVGLCDMLWPERDAPACHVFLDIDGVLCPEPREHDTFDGECLAQFERVMREHPRTRIVITSTWRMRYSLERLREWFSPDIAERVVGVTPEVMNLQGHYRHREVRLYIEENTVDDRSFVVVDDKAGHFPPEVPSVITRPEVGFDRKAARQLHVLLSRMPANGRRPDAGKGELR